MITIAYCTGQSDQYIGQYEEQISCAVVCGPKRNCKRDDGAGNSYECGANKIEEGKLQRSEDDSSRACRIAHVQHACKGT